MPRMGGYVPADHKTRHQDGGRDEISLDGLSGNPVTLASKLTIDQDVPMAGFKHTGLGAGSGAGHSVRYEQVIGVFLPLAGGTMVGDINLGAKKLKTTSMYFSEYSSGIMGLKKTADDSFGFLIVGTQQFQSAFSAGLSGCSFNAYAADNAYLKFTARDTGVESVEIARLVGAADPYFQATLPMVLKPVATTSLPATPVEGMIAYDDTANKLKVYNGSAWETVTSS